MKLLKWLVAVAGTTMLLACGGGGGSESPFNKNTEDPTAPAAASIDVLGSDVQIGSAGDQVTITAVVKTANNVGLADAPIVFAADSGTITASSAATNSAGMATATLSAGGNKSNRSIEVTVTSGGIANSIHVDVVGTTLSVSGATTLPLGATTSISVKAADSKGTAIPNLSISVASALGNSLSATTLVTDASGNAKVTYVASNSGTDRLSFSGGGAAVLAELKISAEDFVFISPAVDPVPQIPVSASQPVKVRYLSAGQPQVGQVVQFAVTAGTVTPQSVATDANGIATANVVSMSASPAVVQATLASQAAQATLPVEFVATVPSKLVLQLSRSAIGPNPGGATAQQAQVLATVTDANANPVKGVTVNFTRLADPSGGNLSQASAVTNSSGQASVQYIAGPIATSSGGVQLSAFVSSAPSVSGGANLTVNQSALFIALGTGNVIQNLDPETYQKDWTVTVTDANSVPVPGVSLTVRSLPQMYGKGTLVWDAGVERWVYGPGYVFCANEDINYDGDVVGKDTNGSGKLEPGNVISVTPGTVTTDANGRARISLIYAESFVPWVRIKLSVQAVVSGTESISEATFVVAGDAGDFTNKSVAPAGETSPFGTQGCALPN